MSSSSADDKIAAEPVDERVRVLRGAKRAVYEKDTIKEILDNSLLVHIAYVAEDGTPVCIPTGYVRDGDFMIVHGKASSALMTHLARGGEVCATVTILDGFVLARSAFHHSMNYRSVVIFATGELITDSDAKLESMKLFTDSFIPGRWNFTRWPNAAELRDTSMCRLSLKRASAKVRATGPVDDKADIETLSHWAGVIPISRVTGTPEKSADLHKGIDVPDHLTPFRRVGFQAEEDIIQAKRTPAPHVLLLAIIGVLVALLVKDKLA